MPSAEAIAVLWSSACNFVQLPRHQDGRPALLRARRPGRILTALTSIHQRETDMSAPPRHDFEWEDAAGVAVVRFTTTKLRDDRLIRALFDQLEQQLVGT